jgi:hypothetical protein
MLQSTFLFLAGIGEATERRLWSEGLTTWDSFLDTPLVPGISSARKALYNTEIVAAQEELARGNARYFARRLKPRDHWRLFDAFRARTVYLDIETTGTAPHSSDITMVGLYGGGRLTTLIRGETLTADRLAEELEQYDVIVTFYGSVFDLPFLKMKYPQLRLDHPHVDLCFAARRLGYRGGLKHLESALGLTRPAAISGLNGWDAARLWHHWQMGDEAALEQLIRYNAADTTHLAWLAEEIYRKLVAYFGPPLPSGTGVEPGEAHRATDCLDNPADW